MRGAAEALPFQSASIDVVICRLVLPYTHNAATLSEISRVLRNGGALLLKYHHARYYLRRAIGALAARRWGVLRHDVLVLVCGALYQVTGWQSRTRLREIFQTERTIRRLLRDRELAISREMPDSNPQTPSYAITRRAQLLAAKLR